MAGDTEKSELLRIAEILLAHGVEFIVVGGQAETIFGSARVTVDIDLCYRRTKGLELLGFLEPLGDYEVISKRALTIRVGEIDLKVIHIDDLIAIKQYLQRPKDRDSLMHLLAIKKIQSESQ